MNATVKNRVRRPLIAMIRFQTLGGLLFALVVPLLLRPANFLNLTIRDNELNTLMGAMLAVFIGYVMTRRLSNYPSVNAGSYVFISFSVSYLIVAGLFLMLRLEYVRSLFIVSFAFCMLWYVTVYFVERRAVKLRYAIVPGGNSLGLIDLTHPQWNVLETPGDYENSYGAVVVDLRHSHLPEWERFVADCALRSIPVYHTKQVKESLTGKVEIEHLSENTFGSLLPSLIYQRFKLTIDVIIALLALPFIIVVLAAAGLVTIVTSGGPVFFTQQRTGYRGANFTVYKLRTMKSIADVTESDGERDDAMTKSDDARITRLGSFLRKYRIDELPQVLNILRGEMSWIGPRPEAIILSDWYEKELPFYRYRHIVRPGISGWAQVNQGHVAEMDQVLEKLHYDFFYIKNHSAWLDFLIVLKTMRIITSGFGSK